MRKEIVLSLTCTKLFNVSVRQRRVELNLEIIFLIAFFGVICLANFDSLDPDLEEGSLLQHRAIH